MCVGVWVCERGYERGYECVEVRECGRVFVSVAVYELCECGYECVSVDIYDCV